MRTIISFFLLLIYTTSFVSCVDTEELAAQKAFLYHLKVVEDYLQSQQDSTLLYVKSIHFLEESTGIESSADGTFIGKLSVGNSDFEKWEKWYLENKDSLKLNGDVVTIK